MDYAIPLCSQILPIMLLFLPIMPTLCSSIPTIIITGQEYNYSNYLMFIILQHQGKFNVVLQGHGVCFWILDSWVGMDSRDETSESATVPTPVGCHSVRLPTSPDYARNVPIMLESVPIMLDISKALLCQHNPP